MRRLLILLLLLVVPAVLHAQQNPQPAAHETAHPAESHGGEGEAPQTYFGIPGWILKIVNMLLFAGVLIYFVGGPVKKAFAERAEAIRRSIEEARERRVKADQMAADIQARLGQIEQEVRAIRERAEAEGERQKRELIAAAEAEAAKILQAARNEVDARVKHARVELTEFAGQLASERAEAILRERINENDQRKIFQDSLKEVGEA